MRERVPNAFVTEPPSGGYSSNLTSAVLRLAQFVEDTGYTGIPLLYSLASQAQLEGYVYNINSALTARDELEDVLDLLQESPVEGLGLVAHSMANRGLFYANRKLRNVVLASPVIDIDPFVFNPCRFLPKIEGSCLI